MTASGHSQNLFGRAAVASRISPLALIQYTMDVSAWARACNATYSQPLHTTIAMNEISSSVTVRNPRCAFVGLQPRSLNSIFD